MIKKTNGHEAEDETGVVPVPEILMQHNEHQKDDENDRFVHYVELLTNSIRECLSFVEPVLSFGIVLFLWRHPWLAREREADDDPRYQHFARW